MSHQRKKKLSLLIWKGLLSRKNFLVSWIVYNVSRKVPQSWTTENGQGSSILLKNVIARGETLKKGTALRDSCVNTRHVHGRNSLAVYALGCEEVQLKTIILRIDCFLCNWYIGIKTKIFLLSFLFPKSSSSKDQWLITLKLSMNKMLFNFTLQQLNTVWSEMEA